MMQQSYWSRIGVMAVALVVVVLEDASICLAQRRPDPVPRQQERADQARAATEEASRKWADAMDKMDPVLLFAFGIDDGSAERALGVNLTPDEAKDTEMLSNALGALMMDAEINTEIVNLDALDARERRQVALLAANDRAAAIDAMAQAVRADWVIACEFVPISPGTYRVMARLIDPHRGREVAVGSYPRVRAGVEADIDSVAAALFLEIANRFESLANRRGNPFTVEIYGIDDRQLTRISHATAELPSVERVLRPSFNRAGEESHGTMTVRFSGWSGLDLSVDLQELLEERFDLVATGLATSEGSITLHVEPRREVPSWRILIDRDAADSAGFRNRFASTYEQRGRQTVAVMIKEMRLVMPPAAAEKEPKSDVIWRPVLEEQLSTGVQAMEDAIAGALRSAGVAVKDGRTLRNDLRALLQEDGSHMNVPVTEAMVDTKLAAMQDFDVLLVGTVETLAANPAANPGELRMTFRASDTDTRELIASQVWPDSRSALAPARVDASDTQDVARYIAGNILDQWYRNKLSEASTIEVRVENVQSSRQLTMLANQLVSAIPEIVGAPNPRYSNNTGTFTLRYSGSYSQLREQIESRSGRLPMDLTIVKLTESQLEFRIRAGE